MGMLPSSQYGSVALLTSLDRSVASNVVLARATDGISNSSVRNVSGGTSLVASSSNTSENVRSGILNSDLSALSIRATE